MNTIIRNIAIIAIAASTTIDAHAHGAHDAGANTGMSSTTAGIVFNDAGYANATSAGPGAGRAATLSKGEIIYVDKAYGPAIYSYGGRTTAPADGANR